MSDGEGDSDVEAVIRNRQQRQQQQLFRDASSSPTRSHHAPTKTKTKRAQPRFLGDNNGNDAIDDLFAGLDDLPEQVDPRGPVDRTAFDGIINTDVAPATTTGDDIDKVFGEGADEVKKKRRVAAKMDETRLLGPKGFPKLLERVTKFKVGPKGSEAKDLERLLNLYQLWAHEMYPKTNLRDTLIAVEKLCHKRPVQQEVRKLREEYKDSLEPKETPAEIAAEPDILDTLSASVTQSKTKTPADEFEAMFDADENAMLAELERDQPIRPPSKVPAVANDEEEEDEFAMLAEFEAAASVPVQKKATPIQQDNFDEDEEAMLAELEASTSIVAPAKLTKTAVTAPIDEFEDAFDADEEAMMAELEASTTASKPSQAPTQVMQKKVVQVVDEFDAMFDDDEAAMMAELDAAA